MWFIILIFIIAIAVMVINLTWQIQKSRLEAEIRREKNKVEMECLAVKNATKIYYGEKQKLNFIMGRSWKR